MRANWRFESPYAQYHSAEQQLQLFPLDTGIFNDLRPKSELSLDQFAELRRLARGRRHSLFVELLDNIRQGTAFATSSRSCFAIVGAFLVVRAIRNSW